MYMQTIGGAKLGAVYVSLCLLSTETSYICGLQLCIRPDLLYTLRAHVAGCVLRLCKPLAVQKLRSEVFATKS